jgi:hypothetical protein
MRPEVIEFLMLMYISSGINIRIRESTWTFFENRDSLFCFLSLDAELRYQKITLMGMLVGI